MKPHRCPVCNGHQTVSRHPYIAGDQSSWDSSDASPYQCKACGGSGVIWENELLTQSLQTIGPSKGLQKQPREVWYCQECDETTVAPELEPSCKHDPILMREVIDE